VEGKRRRKRRSEGVLVLYSWVPQSPLPQRHMNIDPNSASSSMCVWASVRGLGIYCCVTQIQRVAVAGRTRCIRTGDGASRDAEGVRVAECCVAMRGFKKERGLFSSVNLQ